MPEFLDRPLAREGPSVPYKNQSGSNPALRGRSLAAVSTLIAYSSFVQSLLWRLNKFDQLKLIPELHDYEPRHDPTVIPYAAAAAAATVSVADLPTPAPRNGPNNYYTAGDLHAFYLSGKLTPTDLIEHILPLIRRDTSPPGTFSVGFVDSKVELIRAAAEESTARFKAGKPRSPLDGIPVAIKDQVELTGYKRFIGSPIDFTDKGGRTAWCVAKLIEAGAIIIGKTNMHEMGLDTSNNNPHWGTPLNPHNEGYYTGGSSGGSAYATANGLCPISHGVDGGGSIRLPASFCGLFGLKTTHGRISDKAGYEFTDSVGVGGPIASCIDDLALGYRVMAQPDPASRRSGLFPSSLVTEAYAPKAKKVIGVMKDWVARSDPAVLTLFEKAVEFYKTECGYEVVDISIPLLPEAQKAHALTILSECRSQLTTQEIARLQWHSQLLMNVAGGHATANDFLYSQRLRNLLMEHFAFLWDRYPGMLVLTPTTPCAGWKITQPSDITTNGLSDGDSSLRTMEYVYVANFVGAPAITCPMGYTEDNVPVGLMAMGEWGSEEQLLSFGKEGEYGLCAGGIRRPKTAEWLDALLAAKGCK